MLDDLHPGRNDIGLLGDHLADLAPGMPAAARTQLLSFRDVVLDAHAWQIIGKRLAPALAAPVLGNRDLIVCRSFGCRFGCRFGFGLVEKPELIGIGLL